MDTFEKRLLFGAQQKCPYRNNRCPMDITPDEEACCDNDYESCWIYIVYEQGERYGSEIR